MHAEVRHEALSDEVKDALCRAMLGQPEEECLEEAGTKKEKNDEHKLDAKMECFDEYDLDSVSKDEKYLLRNIFEGRAHYDCL